MKHVLIKFGLINLLLLLCLFTATAARADDDSDGDGVPDESDFCNGSDASESLGTAGEASVIHYYFGDGAFKSLAQDVGTNLDNAISGYDYSIALSEDENAGDLQDANRIEEPTKEEFFKAIRDVVRKGYLVDIYIFAHGTGGGFSAKAADDTEDAEDGETDGTVALVSSDIASHLSPDAIGCDGHHAPIRIVYSVSCYHSNLIDAWTGKGGAKASLGARYVNFYPNQFDKFAQHWQDGETFQEAEDSSNTSSSRTASQIYIYADALLKNPVDCALQSPLGKNGCSKMYFESEWLGDDYVESESGQWNMNYASEKLFSGDEDVTINDTEFDWRAASDIEIIEVEMADDWAEVRTPAISTFKSSGSTKGKKIKTQLEGTFEVTVRNGGSYDVGAFYVTGPSGSTVSRVEIASLKSQTITTASFTVRVNKDSDGTPSVDTLTFTADADGALNDSDTSNNAMTIELKPNYEGLLNTMTTTANGDGTYTTEIQCYVRNFGFLATTEETKLNLYFKQSEDPYDTASSGSNTMFRFSGAVAATEESEYGTLIDSHTLPSLGVGNASGNTASHTHTIVTESLLNAAENSFTCVADADDVIDETDEDDNVETECVYCADQEEIPSRLDITYDASRIMTVFEDEYLKYHEVHIPATTDIIIIVVEYMQSVEYFDIVTMLRAEEISQTQFDTLVKTQVTNLVRYF